MLILDLCWLLFAVLPPFVAAIGLATGLVRPLDRRCEGAGHGRELGAMVPALSIP